MLNLSFYMAFGFWRANPTRLIFVQILTVYKTLHMSFLLILYSSRSQQGQCSSRAHLVKPGNILGCQLGWEWGLLATSGQRSGCCQTAYKGTRKPPPPRRMQPGGQCWGGGILLRAALSERACARPEVVFKGSVWGRASDSAAPPPSSRWAREHQGPIVSVPPVFLNLSQRSVLKAPSAWATWLHPRPRLIMPWWTPEPG